MDVWGGTKDQYTLCGCVVRCCTSLSIDMIAWGWATVMTAKRDDVIRVQQRFVMGLTKQVEMNWSISLQCVDLHVEGHW